MKDAVQAIAEGSIDPTKARAAARVRSAVLTVMNKFQAVDCGRVVFVVAAALCNLSDVLVAATMRHARICLTEFGMSY